MRARNIKPGFCSNEDLADCSDKARLLFLCLPMLADREGRLEDRPKRIRAELFPFDNCDADKLLAELANHGEPPFIIRYQNDEGRFIQITGFEKHQSPHYSEKKSTIKPPKLQESNCDYECSTPRNDASSSNQETENCCATERLTFPVGNSLIPDSLIPDSLIPDSTPLAQSQKNGTVLLPIIGGREVPLEPKFVSELESAYPAVDVPATIREIRAWCLANPTRCKTARGIPKFVNAWLAKEQNRG